jgi:methylmalonyl-CoA mutase
MQTNAHAMLMHEIAKMIGLFEKTNGRRPRIMIENIESDDHDFNSRQMASGFADLGFDVDIGPIFHSAQEMAKQAVENDVHFIGITGKAAVEESLLNELNNNLSLMQREDIIIICRGDFLKENFNSGFKGDRVHFFQKSTSIAEVAKNVLTLIYNK